MPSKHLDNGRTFEVTKEREQKISTCGGFCHFDKFNDSMQKTVEKNNVGKQKGFLQRTVSLC